MPYFPRMKRALPFLLAALAAAHAYNSPGEYERLADALAAAAKSAHP